MLSAASRRRQQRPQPCPDVVLSLFLLPGRPTVPAQDTYDMQWSYSGDVVLTTDASRALQLLDIR